jgi:hypothetical protein
MIPPCRPRVDDLLEIVEHRRTRLLMFDQGAQWRAPAALGQTESGRTPPGQDWRRGSSRGPRRRRHPEVVAHLGSELMQVRLARPAWSRERQPRPASAGRPSCLRRGPRCPPPDGKVVGPVVERFSGGTAASPSPITGRSSGDAGPEAASPRRVARFRGAAAAAVASEFWCNLGPAAMMRTW